MAARDVSRRDFMLAAGAAGIGALLGSAGAGAARADEPEEGAKEGGAKKDGGGDVVQRRPLGKTGVDVSVLAMGGMFDIVNGRLVLEQALKYGVNYWDTADCYQGGKSEEGIGAYFEWKPEARKQVFLVTKSDRRDPQGISQLLERSLGRLKTDFVDLYLIHGVKSAGELTPEVKAWAEKAKAAKKIRFFGFSAHENMEGSLEAASKLGFIDAVMFTCNYRIMDGERLKAAMDACAKAGVGLVAMKTQGMGPGAKRGEPAPALDGFLKRGFTEHQARLKAVWERAAVASICSQMPNLTILKANIAAALDRVKLSANEVRSLGDHARATSSSYCAGCTRLCEPAVGACVPIGDVLRQLMYYRAYGEPDLARGLFAAIAPEVRERLATLDYAAAERCCPQGLAIGALMHEAAAVLA